jgi:hypothetical protein
VKEGRIEKRKLEEKKQRGARTQLREEKRAEMRRKESKLRKIRKGNERFFSK